MAGKFMKAIVLAAILMVVNGCASESFSFKNMSQSRAFLYVDPKLRDYVVNATGKEVQIAIFDGMQNSGDYNIYIGEMSSNIFLQALRAYFSHAEVIESESQFDKSRGDYLVKLSLENFELIKDTLQPSDIHVSYNLHVKDSSLKEVYNKSVYISEKGNFKSFSGTSVMGIPIAMSAKLDPEETDEIRKAIFSAARKSVRELSESGAIR